ncbi:MAG: PEP-CTERM sorting domain-containing protein [Bryobacteraceae bacterium]
MKRIISVALFAATALTAGSFTIDDYSVGQGPIITSTVPTTITDGPLAIGGGISRLITLETLAALQPPAFQVEAGFGVFDVNNGTGDDSQVTVDYTIPALPIPPGASNVEFFLTIVQSDANPTSVDLSGVASGSFSIAPNTLNQTVFFSVPGVAFGPGTLTLTFNGAPGWDLSVDSFGVQWKDRSPVPEPSTIGLIGAGLIGLGILRRKQIA